MKCSILFKIQWEHGKSGWQGKNQDGNAGNQCGNAGNVGNAGNAGIKVEMWGIRVGMRRITVRMWGIRVGMQVHKYLKGILQGFC